MKNLVIASLILMAAFGHVAFAEQTSLQKETYVTLEEFQNKQSTDHILLLQPPSIPSQPAQSKRVSLRERKNCTISSKYRMCL